MRSKLIIRAFPQKNWSKWLAGVAFGLLLASGVAEGAQINFDDVADGTIINTHYAGVTFTNPIGGNIYARNGFGFAQSPSNVVSIYATGFPYFEAVAGAVDAHFASPVAVVKIDARPVGPIEFLTPLTKRPFLQAFDSGNNLLNTVYYSGPLPTNCCAEVGPSETLIITSGTTNIAWARFSTQNDAGGVPTYGLFDNLVYDSGAYTLAIHTIGSGSAAPTPNQANYTYGTGVSVLATPAAGWSFAGWSGGASGTANPLPITITSNTDITANFAMVGSNSLTLNAAVTGWYDQNGKHTIGNLNYISGFASDEGTFFHDWFIFTIPTSASPITSAQLKINTYAITATSGEVFYQLWAVTNPAAVVQGTSSSIAIYNDLADGTLYATRDFLTGQSSQTKFIPLNHDLRTALNAAGGTQFVLGGSVLTNINGDTNTDGVIYSFSQGNVGDVQLILTYSNSPVVGYFTDNNPTSTGPNAPIVLAGFTPLQIADITTQDLSGLRVLMIDESANGAPSAGLSSRLPAIQDWVADGGRLVVHDRSAGNVTPNPFLLGNPGLNTVRWTSNDVEVIHPANTLVTAGPYGLVDDSALDGGCNSTHGYILSTNLPSGARAILRVPIAASGGDTNAIVAFSYQLGGGFIYYSTIPLDYYLDGATCGNIGVNAEPIYTPNVLTYVHLLNPSLRILPPAQPVAGTFSLFLADVDGSPITADRLPFITVYSATDLTMPLSSWTTVANSRVITNGLLRIDGLSAAPTQQYFLAEDIPY